MSGEPGGGGLTDILDRLLGRLTFSILVVATLMVVVAIASRTALLRDALADAGCAEAGAPSADPMEVAA